MCGRIDLGAPADQMAMRFGATLDNDYALAPRYNVAPTSMVPVVKILAGGGRLLTAQRWGLEPFSERQNVLFNARDDKLASLRRYKTGIQHKRCIVPVSGFYEWKGGATRTPFYIHSGQTPLIGLAGFWEMRNDRPACTIVTTRANDQVADLHNRMPAILRPEDEAAWLDPRVTDVERLMRMISPYALELEIYEVDKAVNSARLDSPNMRVPVVRPVETASLFEAEG
jgi:putative SOS response-associated peptidase YedK